MDNLPSSSLLAEVTALAGLLFFRIVAAIFFSATAVASPSTAPY
jgi:hypothetical protein